MALFALGPQRSLRLGFARRAPFALIWELDSPTLRQTAAAGAAGCPSGLTSHSPEQRHSRWNRLFGWICGICRQWHCRCRTRAAKVENVLSCNSHSYLSLRLAFLQLRSRRMRMLRLRRRQTTRLDLPARNRTSFRSRHRPPGRPHRARSWPYPSHFQRLPPLRPCPRASGFSRKSMAGCGWPMTRGTPTSQRTLRGALATPR